MGDKLFWTHSFQLNAFKFKERQITEVNMCTNGPRGSFLSA